MANVVKTKMIRNAAVELPAATAITTSGVKVDFSGKDEMILLLIASTASSAVTVTISKGNGIQAVADETVSIPAGKTCGIVLESAKFKNLSDGTVSIKASATGTTVQVVEL